MTSEERLKEENTKLREDNERLRNALEPFATLPAPVMISRWGIDWCRKALEGEDSPMPYVNIAQLEGENVRLREALEWIAEYSAHLAADSVDTLPAAYMRGFRRCQTRAWAALRRKD